MATIPASPVILVPVDGSPSADHAAAYTANRVHRDRGTRVFVINVQPSIETWQTHGLGQEDAIAHRSDIGGRHAARALKVFDDDNIPYEFSVEFGEPAETIVRAAREKGCTNIVMGTRGLGEIASLVLGSVAMKVVHLTDLPVTLVK